MAQKIDAGRPLNPIPRNIENMDFDGFKFFGRGKPLVNHRTNMEEAEKAFLTSTNDILTPFLEKNHFIRYDEQTYIRLNDIDVLEVIYLQKNERDSLISPCFLLVPLYMRNNAFGISRFAVRLATIINQTEFWWNYNDINIANKTFQNIVDGINKFGLKWFNRYNDEEILQEDLQSGSYRMLHFGLAWNAHMVFKNGSLPLIDEFFRKKYKQYYLRDTIAYFKIIYDMQIYMGQLKNEIYNPKLFIEENIRENIKEYGLPENYNKKYKYKVGDVEYEIEDILPILLFFDVIINYCENKQRGSVYSNIMSTLYVGKMSYESGRAVANELIRLKKDLNIRASNSDEIKAFLEENQALDLFSELVSQSLLKKVDISLIGELPYKVIRTDIFDNVASFEWYRLP